VQIWDKPAVGSGGLYNNQKYASAPLFVADRPPGEWNTFRILMSGERVTVYLNGVLVVDDTPLENYWERSKPVYPRGQIELQNHGIPDQLAINPELAALWTMEKTLTYLFREGLPAHPSTLEGRNSLLSRLVKEGRWRPWEGRWYRSRHHDSGWQRYKNTPSFYRHIPNDWRANYRDRHWQGRQWNINPIPHQQVQKNWHSWKTNRHWEGNQSWGVQDLQRRRDSPRATHKERQQKDSRRHRTEDVPRHGK